MESERKLTETVSKGRINTVILSLLLLMIVGIIIYMAYINGDHNLQSRDALIDFLLTITSPMIALSALLVAIFTYRQKEIENEKRRIESIFFQLLKLQVDIVNEMEYEKKGTSHSKADGNWDNKGRSYFRLLYEDLIHAFREKTIKNKVTDQNEEELVYQSCAKVLEKEKDNLLHYTNNLYLLTRWIHKHCDILKPHERREYILFIRAQLAKREMIILYFYTWLVEDGQLYHLLNKYGFFTIPYTGNTQSPVKLFLEDAWKELTLLNEFDKKK